MLENINFQIKESVNYVILHMNTSICFSFKSLKENGKNSEFQQSPNHTIPD